MDQVEGEVTGVAYQSGKLLDAMKELGTARTGEVPREYLGMDQKEGYTGAESSLML
jgi:hypothetical protein